MPVAFVRSFMDAISIVGTGGALVAGFSGSLHCALMCGPLACAAGTGKARASVFAYHGMRIGSYAMMGGVLGLAGKGVVSVLSTSVQPYLPWVMAAALVATALDVGKRLRPLPGVRRVASALTSFGAKFSPTVRAGAIGAATPFLPCGLLYGVMLAALAAGSVAGGAAVMGAFSLGAVPALLVAQLQGRLLARSPRLNWTMKHVLPIAAAVVLVWRAVAVQAAPEAPPTCH